MELHKALEIACKYSGYKLMRIALCEWDELTIGEKKIFNSKRKFTEIKTALFWILKHELHNATIESNQIA